MCLQDLVPAKRSAALCIATVYLIIEIELPGARHICKLEFAGERFMSVCVQGSKLVKSLPRSSLLAQPMLGQQFLKTATALLTFAINAPMLPKSPAGTETISGICPTIVPYICFCHAAIRTLLSGLFR